MRLLMLLQADVTHPTVNIAGIDFNADTIRNTLIVCAILLVAALILRSQLRVGKPTQLQNVIELVVEYIGGLTAESLQGRNLNLGPLAITLFVFLLVSNWIGLIPGFKSPTNDWNTTLALALSNATGAASVAGLGREENRPFSEPMYSVGCAG